MRTHRVRLIVALVALGALAACSTGGGSHPTGLRTGTANPSSKADSYERSSTSGSALPGNGGSGTAKPSAGGSTTPRPNVVVHATLDKACVHRGDKNDVQGITIQARPGGAAGYTTTYSDGSGYTDGTSTYPPRSGDNGGFADSSGRYHDTWVVPANAPLGKATVTAVAVEDSSAGPAQGQTQLTFVVKGIGQSC